MAFTVCLNNRVKVFIFLASSTVSLICLLGMSYVGTYYTQLVGVNAVTVSKDDHGRERARATDVYKPVQDPTLEDEHTEIEPDAPDTPSPEKSENDTGEKLRTRLRLIKQECSSHPTDYTTSHRHTPALKTRLFRNSDYQLVYCAIEKVGSSFWKRVFKVLSDQGKKNIHVFDMPSMSAHHKIPKDMALKDTPKDTVTSVLTSYTSFMFTRDPFSRLFSGFVDKMVLPNPVGQGYTNQIAKTSRVLPETRAKIVNGSLCQYNLTFQDVAWYIANTIVQEVGFIEAHFTPVYEHCQPCNINYTFVGQMETFIDDTKYILSSVGISLGQVTGDEEEKTDEMNDKGIMEDIANRSFAFLHKPAFYACAGTKEVLARLWRVYQIRGYISKKARLPRFKEPDKVRVGAFIAAAWDVYDKSTVPPAERHAQREEALEEAFASLAAPVQGRVQQAFARDCQLFGYNCDLNTRFPRRDQPGSHGFSYLDFRYESV